MEKFYNDFINIFIRNIKDNYRIELGIPFFLNNEIFSSEYIISLDFLGGPNGTFYLFLPSAFYEENFNSVDELSMFAKNGLNVSGTQFGNLEFSKTHLSRNKLSADLVKDTKSTIVYPLFLNSKKLLVVITVSSENE
jgi:hypothetical protein